MKRKVILYNPEAVFYTMPLGLMAVGSCLDAEKFDVRIIDGRLEADPVAAVIEQLEGALCLGVSVLTGAPIGDALKIVRAAKQKFPAMPVIFGGWHPSLFPEATLEEECIDVTVQGQGEATFVELIARLDQDGALGQVAGITYRQGSKIIRNPSRPMMPMEVFPPVNYGLIPVDRYFAVKGRRQMDYVSSTGCLFRCAFCADPFVHNRGWQAIGAVRAADEIQRLWDRYHFDDLSFQDETFFTYRKRIEELTEEFLRRDMSFSWAATMRADQGVRLGEELFEQCVRSGMRRVLIGVESGSPQMLERIRKDTTIEQVLESAEMCARHGVDVIFSFIVGFPDETDEDVMKTVALVKQLRAMSAGFETPIFYYKPYPGSEISEQASDEMPQTLDDWANFDFVQGDAGRWVSAETYQMIERFKFYNRYAWGAPRLTRVPLRLLSRWRCDRNYYGFPIEKAIVQKLRPEVRLS